MEGNAKVIDGLNSLLGYELAAMDQYFIHSQMYDDWGLTKLYERIAHDMLESDLRVEYEVAAKLKEVIALAETEQDYVTRDMLLILLDDTEMDHAHWLEQQLGLIKRLGLPNYLQSQM